MTNVMVAEMTSMRGIRVIAFVIKNILVRQCAEYAANNNVSLIFLPSHKSHVDYLVISPSFNAVTTVEAFIEGTRRRIGKLLQPKFGILKIIMDVVLVPMAIGYDKVIETESYVKEMLGTPKQEGVAVPNNINILGFKWGRTDIRFAKPYSLKDYVASKVVRRGQDFKPTAKANDKALLSQSLRYSRWLDLQNLSDIHAAGVTAPTALVGTVLLTLRGRGVGRDEVRIELRVNWPKREILRKGGWAAIWGYEDNAILDG
ncbi:hypothetical protein HK104_001738 [Borealophlyctis nickersoniae]|nr:hypothetical protein HK104_001738 [Borealophlyctis nickersoniae]